MVYWIVYFFVLGAGLGLSIGLMAVGNRFRRWGFLQNAGLLLLSLVITFMAAEFYFKVIFAQTENRNFTLASQNWFNRYWRYNSWGYRDVEWTEAELTTRKRVLVVGDSFAAGQGIEHVEDRFSNLLNDLLGDSYIVMNISHPGLSTKEEIDRLTGFSYKPEILILQYFINDIRHAAEEKQIIFERPDVGPKPIFKPLVDNSYALNFIYWRGILLGPQKWQGDNMAWLESVYNHPDVWWIHQQELDAIYQGTLSENVKLIVVVFPALNDVERSRPMTGRVVNFFLERGVPVLDVASLVEGQLSSSLTISNLDAHPGKWLHRQVAESLYKMVTEVEASN